MKRQQANRRILECLEAMIDKHPDQRFVQLLFNLDVLKTRSAPEECSCPTTAFNEYATESTATLDRIRASKVWNE